MATIHRTKSSPSSRLPPGATYPFRWNNPPACVIAYYVVANPKTPVGQHSVTHGAVELGKVATHRSNDNFNADETSYAAFDVVNTGTEATGADIYQTWLD